VFQGLGTPGRETLRRSILGRHFRRGKKKKGLDGVSGKGCVSVPPKLEERNETPRTPSGEENVYYGRKRNF